MKKVLLMIVAAMVATVSVNAQERKHEVAFSLGWLSNSQVLDFYEDLGGAMSGAQFENEKYIGPISVEYFYHVKPWLGVGGIIAYGQNKQDVFFGHDKDGEIKNNYTSLLPAVKFDWLRKSHFGMYSKVAFGATMRNENYERAEGQPKRDYDEETVVHVNWQISAIGIEFGGEQLRGFAELGTGEQGVALAGLRYKF